MSAATKTDRFKMERQNEKIAELTATAEQRLEMICTLHDDIAEMHGELEKTADRLNRVIAVAEWRRTKVQLLEKLLDHAIKTMAHER
jgi:hypothetical protein